MNWIWTHNIIHQKYSISILSHSLSLIARNKKWKFFLETSLLYIIHGDYLKASFYTYNLECIQKIFKNLSSCISHKKINLWMLTLRNQNFFIKWSASKVILGHIRWSFYLKIYLFFNIFFCSNLILSKLEMNANFIKTQFFLKIKYDLKGYLSHTGFFLAWKVFPLFLKILILLKLFMIFGSYNNHDFVLYVLNLWLIDYFFSTETSNIRNKFRHDFIKSVSYFLIL